MSARGEDRRRGGPLAGRRRFGRPPGLLPRAGRRGPGGPLLRGFGVPAAVTGTGRVERGRGQHGGIGDVRGRLRRVLGLARPFALCGRPRRARASSTPVSPATWRSGAGLRFPGLAVDLTRRPGRTSAAPVWLGPGSGSGRSGSLSGTSASVLVPSRFGRNRRAAPSVRGGAGLSAGCNSAAGAGTVAQAAQGGFRRDRPQGAAVRTVRGDRLGPHGGPYGVAHVALGRRFQYAFKDLGGLAPPTYPSRPSMR